MDETKAIARIKRGDLAGVELLVRYYQAKAVQAAYLVVRDRPLAEDVVQAAFLKAVERIDQFDDSRPFGPWFLRSVVNAAIDASQQQKRLLPLEREARDEATTLADWLTSDAPYPEELVEMREVRLEVRKALDALSPEQRAAVVLRHFLEMSEAEMTDTLHRPPSTIKWWLHTARKRLRELLRPTWQAKLDEKQEGLYDE
jgi:RNA polymerase sigma-70 factor (ECF subfamily)